MIKTQIKDGKCVLKDEVIPPKLELIADLSHGNTDITCPYSKMKWHTSATLGLFKGVLAWDLDLRYYEVVYFYIIYITTSLNCILSGESRNYHM